MPRSPLSAILSDSRMNTTHQSLKALAVCEAGGLVTAWMHAGALVGFNVLSSWPQVVFLGATLGGLLAGLIVWPFFPVALRGRSVTGIIRTLWPVPVSTFIFTLLGQAVGLVAAFGTFAIVLTVAYRRAIHSVQPTRASARG